MADLNVIYRIAADITGLQDGVNRAANATEGLESTVGRVGKALTSAFSVTAVLEFGRVTTQAFGEAEAALRRLETALVAQGQHTPAVTQQYQDLAAQFQKTTAFSDDLVLEMEALLVQVGNVMPRDMEKALTAATNLAAGLGIDLRTATMLVGKAFEGETGTLKRYGIVIDETKLKTDGAAAVLEAINDKFGGQAQAQVETYTGKLAQFNNQINDSQEHIGGLISQGLTPLFDAFSALPGPLQDVVGGISTLSPSFQNLALGLLAIGGPSGAATLASGAIGGLGAACAALWPVVAVGATAWVSWELGTVIGDVTGLTNGIENLTGRVMGLSQEEINASREAREFVETWQGMDEVFKKLQATAPALITIKDPLKAVALEGAAVTAVIKEMDRALDVQHANQRVAEEEAKRRAEAAKKRAEEERQIILLNQQTEHERVQAWVRDQDVRGLREMQDLAESFQRETAAAAAEAALLDANAQAHREMLNDIGVANMNATAERMAQAEQESQAWKGHVRELAGAFTQLAQVAGGALGGITRGIGTMFSALSGAIDAVGTLKSGFGSLGGGSTLAGIASIASGIGGIVGIAQTAISVVKSLWKWATGGEEGRVVNPARDAWFAGRSVQDIGDDLAPFMEGDAARQMIQDVFDAKTKADLDTATSAIDAVLNAPSLAAGGLVRQPTLAMIGESGPELVTPLHRLGPTFGGAGDPTQAGLGAVQPPVIVNLSIAIDGVFSEGDLVQTVQRRVAPILAQTIEDNVAGSRTRFQDVLGVP